MKHFIPRSKATISLRHFGKIGRIELIDQWPDATIEELVNDASAIVKSGEAEEVVFRHENIKVVFNSAMRPEDAIEGWRHQHMMLRNQKGQLLVLYSGAD